MKWLHHVSFFSFLDSSPIFFFFFGNQLISLILVQRNSALGTENLEVNYIENQELSDLEELNLHLIENKDDSTLYGHDMNYGIFFKLESFLFSNIFHIFVFVFLLLFEASAQNTTQLQILLLLLRLKSKEFRVYLRFGKYGSIMYPWEWAVT